MKRFHRLNDLADQPQAYGQDRPLTVREQDGLDFFRGMMFACIVSVPLLALAAWFIYQ